MKTIGGAAASLTLQPRQSSVVRFTGKSYFLIAETQTENPETIKIGWIIPQKLKRRDAMVSLVVDGRSVNKTKEVTYPVARAVQEMKTREVPVTSWKKINGFWHCETEVRTEAYTATNYVYEQGVKAVTYKGMELNATAQSSSGELMSQVTIKTKEKGAYIKYQLAARDEIKIGRNPTNSTESFPVGTYLFWTERNEKPTSAKTRYDIYAENEDIVIPEKSPIP